MTSCQVFIMELNRLRSPPQRESAGWAQSPAYGSSPFTTEKIEEQLLSSAHRCLAILGYFGAESLLISEWR